MIEKPKIYVFSNVHGGREGVCYALAEDGECLGSHYCSHELFAPGDLGAIPGSRSDRHETYAKHYPDGYEMVFVPNREMVNEKNEIVHPGIKRAFELNAAKKPDETVDPN